MSGADHTKVSIGGVIIIILLLLYLKFGRSTNTVLIHDKPVKIDVELPPVSNYNLPPLTFPKVGGAWDWMQTTDLSCGCDAGLFKAPVLIAPTFTQPQSYPVYKYIVDNQYQAGPTYNFPIYTPPPLPTWHWEYGWSDAVGRYENRMYPVTEDGVTILMGKYGRTMSDAYGSYPSQTKQYTLSGGDLYVGSKRYRHEPQLDHSRPSSYQEGKPDSKQRADGGWNTPNPPLAMVYTQ